jgi:asparagine N-glycosylation enzyme membrane subunit Stt3
MQPNILLLLLSFVFMIELYLAQRRQRPEIFYAMAGLTLFAALLTVSHVL